MEDIKKKVIEMLNDDKAENALFEVSNIVVYTRNKDLFLNGVDKIREVAKTIKKRIEVRMSPQTLTDSKEAEKIIKNILAKENISAEEFWFDNERSLVYIEMVSPESLLEKPNLIKEIKEKTNWSIQLNRYPIVKSDLVRAIREMLYTNFSFRKRFLDEIGERIYYSNVTIDPKKYWVRVTGLGGFRQVGRSAILLQTSFSRILLDVGIDVGSKENPYPVLDAPEFRIGELTAIVISHSHLDHCGFLPVLFRYGYRGPVFTTAPTRDVFTLLHLDYLNLSQKNKGIDQLFSVDDIKEMLKHTITLNYREVTDISPDVRITFYDAGHILGSGMVHANLGNGLYNILYTGDFKFSNTRTLNKPQNVFDRVEAVITESTYGGDFDYQPKREESEKFLYEIIKKTVEEGGKVLIPVLAVGRAQELILMFDEWKRNNLMPDLPIYLDGMLRAVSAIYTVYPEFLKKEVREQIIHYDNNPFLSPSLKSVASKEERDKLLSEGPSIILATSGMLEGGPALYYLANMCEDKRNSIVLVSYQGENTLGRQLSYGAKEIDIEVNGIVKRMHVNAKVYLIEGFSGHSDRGQLAKFILTMKPKPKIVLVVHGEERKSREFAEFLRKSKINAIVPPILEGVRLR
ncbi:MAG: beta-CASP ribonuclease aCPSF1 [Candidatus Rehaiarchaeum fermentans]|nr:beta-CASP ribonuclease aCPSF1 [Candidatus Rehaiarchaeum fermentans]MCW1302517.1 beta-CASP ribonuclease aCPSF1 [Candidatus Rehaiarchaeum fermentans]